MSMTNGNVPVEVEIPSNALAINLAGIESVSAFARRINYDALDIDELKKYERDNNLLAEEQSHEQHVKNDCGIAMLGIEEMDHWQSISIPVNKITIKDFCTPSHRTLVYGDSNVGKSYVLQCIALGYSTGNPSFFFSATSPSKVVYIDGEMADSFFSRLNQLHDGHNEQYIKDNLKVIPSRGISLTDENIQNNILNNLKFFNPALVIIDNLISLFPDAVKGNTNNLLSFVRNIESIGAAVIIVHHTGKDAKTYKGAIELVALCQNVIHLKGRKQITEEFEKENLKMSLPLARAIESRENGPVISMLVEKCKVCPALERQPHYYCLPIDGKWERINVDVADDSEELAREALDNVAAKTESGDEMDTARVVPGVPISVAHQAADDGADVVDSSCDQQNQAAMLPPDERKMFQCIQANPGGVKRTEIDDALGWSESKTRGVLNSLIGQGIVERCGQGKGQFYKPKVR